MNKKMALKKIQPVLFLLFVLFFTQLLFAQDGPLILSWDKLGCQQDTVKKVNFDDQFNLLPCLSVCQGSTNIYRISGTYAGNVDHVIWTVTGGHKEEDKDLFAIPITWDNTANGTLRIQAVLQDSTMLLDKTICIDKFESSLVFGWDKIGCQMNKNNVSEIKFDDNFPNSGCLRVCKEIKSTYKIYGGGTNNIHNIQWIITGGTTEVDNENECTINWDDTDTGSINIQIQFNDETVADRTICVDKFKSSLVLEWDKIDESAVRQIKVDNSIDNADIILAYPESTVLYKLDGKEMGDVQSVNWIITGGYAYNPNQFTAIITWEEADEHVIQINATYEDGTTLSRNINIVQFERSGTGGNSALNGVQFTYDSAGNQKLRSFITLPARHKGPGNDKTDGNIALIKSDLYDDISYYPNPVRSELYVTWKNEFKKDVQQLELYNLNGMMLKTFTNSENKQDITINFEQYPTGIYDLLLVYTNGEKKSLKIVKQ